MINLQEFTGVLENAADVARNLKRKVSYFAAFGLAASAGLAWVAYSPESSLTWNIIKCGLVLLPILVICFVWQILNQITDAPSLVTQIASDEDGIVQNLQTLKLNKTQGVRGLINTVRTLRDTEELGDFVDLAGGIVILANPFFIVISFVSMIVVCLLILIAPFILIF